MDKLHYGNYEPIKSLEDFKNTCHSFVSRVEIEDFDYDEEPVFCGCKFKRKEKYGIKSCGQYHNFGFIIRTVDGKFYNIGQDCGKRQFGTNYRAEGKPLVLLVD